MKRRISLFVAVVLVLVALISYGKSSEETDKDVYIKELEEKVALQESIIEEDYQRFTIIHYYMDESLKAMSMSLDYDTIENGIEGLYITVQRIMNEKYDLEVKLENYEIGE